MQVVAIIPARYEAERLPGKALIDLAGKPMIQHVYERTCQARTIEEVMVATDDDRIRAAVEAFGGKAVLTARTHPSGTDRIAEVARRLTCDIVVNVQGDEPLIEPRAIDAAVQPLLEDPGLVMSTLKAEMTDPEEIQDESVVKVVTDLEDFALYFSRYPIPYCREGQPARWYKHIGLYVYRREFLLLYASWPPTPLQNSEGLEQLRVLEHGYRIKVVETPYASIGVDTPADVERVRAILAGPQ